MAQATASIRHSTQDSSNKCRQHSVPGKENPGFVNSELKESSMDQTVQQSADPLLQWVTFRLDNETYGINVMQVQEVLRITEIAPVPGAPEYVLGIVNLRGNVVTVIDTRKRFGLPPRDMDDATRIVITEVEGQVIGILVDSVAEVLDLRVSAIDTAPNVGNEESAKFIQGVASVEGELLILIDLNRLLTEDELMDISGIQA